MAEYCCSPHRRWLRFAELSFDFLGAPQLSLSLSPLLPLSLSPLLPLARWRAMRRRGKARRIVAARIMRPYFGRDVFEG